MSFRSRRPSDRDKLSIPLLVTTRVVNWGLNKFVECFQAEENSAHQNWDTSASIDCSRPKWCVNTLWNSTCVTDLPQSHNQLRGAGRLSWTDLESLDLTHPLTRIHSLNHLNCLWTISNPSLRDKQTTATLSSSTAFGMDPRESTTVKRIHQSNVARSDASIYTLCLQLQSFLEPKTSPWTRQKIATAAGNRSSNSGKQS